MKKSGCLPWLLGVLLLWVIGVTVGDDSKSVGNATDTSVSQAISAGTASAGPTSTVALNATVDDLPNAPSFQDGSSGVLVLQRLLNRTCCEVIEDGVWGPATEVAVRSLRQLLGLSLDGGLDSDLWSKLLDTVEQPPLEPMIGLEGLKIPSKAVMLDDQVASLNPSARQRFILPFHASADSVVAMVLGWNQNAAIGPWRWCETYGGDDPRLSMFWWQPGGRMLSISVRDKGSGRVEINTVVEEGADNSGCQGATRSTAEVQVVDSGVFRYETRADGWQWRPVAQYRNNSDATVTSLRVRWTMTGTTNYRIHYSDQVDAPIPPGQAIEVMPSRWFLLNLFDIDQQELGFLLGSGLLTIENEIEYIQFDDGSTAGSP